jgi:hypothetical protein
MDIIRPEMLTGEVTRWDLLPLSFLKKSAYTGSKGALRYRIEKVVEEITSGADASGEAQAKEITMLRVSTWNGPNAFDLTPAEEIRQKDFGFTDDALYKDIVSYLNEQRKMTQSV